VSFKPVARAAGADPYADLHLAIKGLLEGEPDFIANCANFSALVYTMLPDLNWAGCYLLRGNELVLGPFQGKPACVRIAMGRGVCGTSAQSRASVLVDDVHAFDGHIVCDPDSRSELVVPMIKGDKLLGVFDMDSPLPKRFDAADQASMEAAIALLMNACQT
jgi:GAF domain-containing protein